MRVLIAYATKHGSTAEIAERIGEDLAGAGHEVDVAPVDRADPRDDYDAFVIGSATYADHWRKEATAFVKDHHELFAAHPTWLFSSGPVGAETTDDEGRDLREVTEPAELPMLTNSAHPRGHRVFFGAVDPTALTLPEKALRKLPAGRAMLPEGDFRDWADIDAWATSIEESLHTPHA